MRRCATSERTMIPAKTLTSPGAIQCLAGLSMYQPRPRRLRNPDQLRRRERYHRAVGEFRNVSLTTNAIKGPNNRSVFRACANTGDFNGPFGGL